MVDHQPATSEDRQKLSHAPALFGRASTWQMGVVAIPTVPSVAAHPTGRVSIRPARSRASVAPPRALPPANEIAGFVLGAGLIGLVFAASRLDGVIADAQVRGFERDKDERWKKTTKSVEGGGNIFILPDDEEE